MMRQVKILVVDDDQFNVTMLQTLLESFKLNSDYAVNGALAVQKVKDQLSQGCCSGYKLIFMDVNMPVMDGFEATREIKKFLKEKDEKLSMIIVACTAYVFNEKID